MSDYVRQFVSISTFSNAESWVVLSDIEQRIKTKIEAVGTPLKDWDINIYRGILTGFNEAFIIDGKKKDELVSQDPKSAEIIRPILRGRDIKRYEFQYADLFIIATFPSLKIDIDNYPIVKQHLLSFNYDRLKQTGDQGARKKTNNKWFETQDSISYWDDFNRQKIIWGEISDKAKFAIDLEGKYLNEATTFLMTGSSLEYLVGYLNSKISEYIFSKIATTTGVGTVRWKKFTIEQLPVPKLNQDQHTNFTNLVRELVLYSKLNSDCSLLEKELNHIVYKAFDFSVEEIGFIESQ